MRIGIDSRMYSPKFTGIGRYVKELIDNLSEIDQQNEYVLFFNEEEYKNYMPPNPRISKRRVNAEYYSLKEQTAFVRDLNREELDLMHFCHFNAPILYKKPSIVTIHDLTLSKFPGQHKTSRLHRIGYQMTIKNIVKKAERIITVSEYTKEDAIRLLGARVDRIRVIYEGVSKEFKKTENLDKLNKIKEKYKITKPFFLYIGAWRSHKNLPNLIKAYNLLRNKYDTNHQLVLAGKGASDYTDVQDTIKEFGLTSHIITPGYIPDADMPLLYQAADVFTFPSLYEGFGLPPLEAMACGTPTAVSNVSSVPEICGASNAVYFNPEDINDMADKLYLTLTDEKLREKLIVNGYNRAKEFKWRKMAEQTLKLYQDVGTELAIDAKSTAPKNEG